MLRAAQLSRAALALVALSAFTPVFGHEGDPKLLDRMEPYRGPGFRGAWTARPQMRAMEAGLVPEAVSLSDVMSPVAFPASGVELLAWIPLEEFDANSTTGADCWGYVSGSGREYAIMGTSNGTGFVEISTPSDPQVIAFIPGPTSLWKDVKVYQTYAYSVSEGGDGIQVIDLSQIDSGIVTHVTDITFGGSTTATHNVAINTDSGYLYRCGGADEGLRIYDLSNPASPTFVASWPDRYVHDVQVVSFTSGPLSGKEIAYACTGFSGGFVDTGLDIIDVTNKGNLVNLDRFFYPNPAYSHQAWLSEDRDYLYLNDELDENGVFPTTTYVIDVSDVNDASLAGSFTNGNSAVGHNIYVEGDLVYEANYRSGLRVFDTSSSPTSPTEVAWFDTFPSDDNDNFNGLWSNYPYFPSGVVIGSDIEKGLFVWWVGDPLVDITYPGGKPTILDPDGTSFTVNVTGGGSGGTFSGPVPGKPIFADWGTLEGGGGKLVPGSPTLHYDSGSGLQSVPMVSLGGGDYRADVPATPCGQDVVYYVTAESKNGIVWRDPPGTEDMAYRITAADALGVDVTYDMESTSGWVSGDAGDDATTGFWERGDPLGTDAQPENDHSTVGTDCWFTGQGSFGGSVGENDVDDGKTTLLSPTLDLTGLSEPRISYWRWYNNVEGGNFPDDVFEIDISDDNGSSWTNVETIGINTNDAKSEWLYHEFRVADFVSLTNQVRVRFVASDLGGGNIVEAAIDDFEVSTRSCADCDGDGISDAMAIASGSSLDTNGNGLPDECEAPLVIGDRPDISVGRGGAQALQLRAGAAFAGEPYIVLGSASGTRPGTVLGGHVLPLNFDGYTRLTLVAGDSPVMTDGNGTLDASGGATARVVLPSASDPALVGVTIHHAFVVFDGAVSADRIRLVSNAVPVALVP